MKLCKDFKSNVNQIAQRIIVDSKELKTYRHLVAKFIAKSKMLNTAIMKQPML